MGIYFWENLWTYASKTETDSERTGAGTLTFSVALDKCVMTTQWSHNRFQEKCLIASYMVLQWLNNSKKSNSMSGLLSPHPDTETCPSMYSNTRTRQYIPVATTAEANKNPNLQKPSCLPYLIHSLRRGHKLLWMRQICLYYIAQAHNKQWSLHACCCRISFAPNLRPNDMIRGASSWSKHAAGSWLVHCPIYSIVEYVLWIGCCCRFRLLRGGVSTCYTAGHGTSTIVQQIFVAHCRLDPIYANAFKCMFANALKDNIDTIL